MDLDLHIENIFDYIFKGKFTDINITEILLENNLKVYRINLDDCIYICTVTIDKEQIITPNIHYIQEILFFELNKTIIVENLNLTSIISLSKNQFTYGKINNRIYPICYITKSKIDRKVGNKK